MIDSIIERYYNLGFERDRLSTKSFRLERDRTLRILERVLPQQQLTIVDVGGAAGAYAFWLAERGHYVHLVDPVDLHLDQAREREKQLNIALASISKGKAQSLENADASADVVMLFGPLYHLLDKSERLHALREAHRVLKPGGIFLATAITRFASYMDGLHLGLIFDDGFIDIINKDLKTGQHKSFDPRYFTHAYFHHPHELKSEVSEAGFSAITLHAIEGPVWHQSVVDDVYNKPDHWQKVLEMLDLIEEDESIIGASAHFMAIARR